MSNQDQLLIVVTAFEEWRKNRTSHKVWYTSTTTSASGCIKKSLFFRSNYHNTLDQCSQFKQWCKDYQSLNEPTNFFLLPVHQDP